MASPSETVHSSGMFALTSRQPSVVDTASTLPAGNARDGFGSTHGARVIDSTPPVSTISASPVSIIREPPIAASSDEPQSRLTVEPGTDTGKPGQQGRHPGHVAVLLAGAVGVAEDHLLDRLRVQPGRAVADGAEDDGAEVVGAYAGQPAAELAERGADGVVDERVAHESPCVVGESSSSSTPWAIRNAVFASGTPQ